VPIANKAQFAALPEDVVEKLEGGDLTLDEALKQFEEGVKLARGLNMKIEESRRKVEQLLKGKDGKMTRKLLEAAGEEEEDEADEEDEDDEEDDGEGKSGKKDQETLF